MSHLTTISIYSFNLLYNFPFALEPY